MKGKREAEPEVEIHKGDVWRFKNTPTVEVEVVEQDEDAVRYKLSCEYFGRRYRSEFLEEFELVRRTKKWNPANEGKPR